MPGGKNFENKTSWQFATPKTLTLKGLYLLLLRGLECDEGRESLVIGRSHP